VAEFKERIIAEIRHEKLDIVKERDFRRGGLLEKCHKLHSACISTTSRPIFIN